MTKETVREESSLDLRYQKHTQHFPPPLDFIAFKKSKSFLRLMNHFQAIAKTKNLDNPNLRKIEKNIHLFNLCKQIYARKVNFKQVSYPSVSFIQY